MCTSIYFCSNWTKKQQNCTAWFKGYYDDTSIQLLSGKQCIIQSKITKFINLREFELNLLVTYFKQTL